MLDRDYFDSLSNLGPFEIKDELIKLARTGAEKSAKTFLNAGRGNPNWIATRAREAFFLLGQFALTEAKRSYHDPDAGVAGMPPRDGAHSRFRRSGSGCRSRRMAGTRRTAFLPSGRSRMRSSPPSQSSASRRRLRSRADRLDHR